jgi:hypothetical protein
MSDHVGTGNHAQHSTLSEGGAYEGSRLSGSATGYPGSLTRTGWWVRSAGQLSEDLIFADIDTMPRIKRVSATIAFHSAGRISSGGRIVLKDR